MPRLRRRDVSSRQNDILSTMNEPHYYSRIGCVASTQGGNLPHWSQHCATFVTFRLGDSLPEGKLERLQAEREEWLKAHPRFQRRRDVLVASDKEGLNPSDAARCRVYDLRSTELLSGSDAARCRVYVDATSRRVNMGLSVDEEESEYRELFSERIQRWLDAGHGSCILRQAEVRQIVEDALRHFADIRYSLYAFVVMPNHVHVLFMPEEGCDGRKIVQGWKSYTAKVINRVLRRTGAVWQKESYDHLVRDVEEFKAIRAYIRRNNAKLAYDAYFS